MATREEIVKFAKKLSCAIFGLKDQLDDEEFCEEFFFITPPEGFATSDCAEVLEHLAAAHYGGIVSFGAGPARPETIKGNAPSQYFSFYCATQFDDRKNVIEVVYRDASFKYEAPIANREAVLNLAFENEDYELVKKYLREFVA